jgi:hypothetical protein
MVVFAQGSSTPQTYMNRLKSFAEKNFSTAEIVQSNPAVVLCLDHIAFDLVAALASYGDYYLITAPASSYDEWTKTKLSDINSRLAFLNNANGSLITPMIRLLKIWNADNDCVFDSFGLEKWIVGQVYHGCITLRDYVFDVVEQLNVDYHAAEWKKDKLKRAKNIVANIKRYESQGLQADAEAEIKKLIPESASAIPTARDRRECRLATA